MLSGKSTLFVIPSEARNLSAVEPKKERFLGVQRASE